MRVEWTELALAQLDEAMAYIARDRPQVAARWLEDVLGQADELTRFPDQGRVAPEASRDDIRELIIGPYRLIYRRDSDAIYITMFKHGRQLLDLDDVG